MGIYPQILLSVAFYIALLFLGFWLHHRGLRRRYGYPTCFQCRHNLTGILGVSEQCPECGCVIKDGEFRGADAMRPSGCVMHTIGFLIIALYVIAAVVLFTIMTVESLFR